MGDHSSENYLDQLLNSMQDNEMEPVPEQEEELEPEEAFARELFGGEEKTVAKTTKNEEDFLREFEEELLRDDIPDYTDSLKNATKQEKAQQIDAELDNLLDNLPQAPVETEPEPAPEPEPEEHIEQPAEAPEGGDDFEVNTLDEAVGAFDESLPKTEDGELDLSGLSEVNLMDMLSDDNGLSDLGDMLSSEEEGRPMDEAEDAIENFAEAQMKASEEASAPPQEDDAAPKKGKKKKKAAKEKKEGDSKGGFLAKLSHLFFGDDEEDETALGGGKLAGVDELSAENAQILKALDGEEDADGKKKKKDKKEKKEKKEKAPKPKKEKKPKAPKQPKEKKPKPVDNTPPLPKKPVIAIVIMVASLFALVMLMTNYIGYDVKVSEAKELYDEGSYVEAYQNLQGLTVKESDAELYNKLSLLAAVYEKYQAYLVFDNYGSNVEALDALICAYGRYDLNQSSAEELDCEQELDALGGKILKALLATYDMTGEEALALYDADGRDDYTEKLYEKLWALGLE